MVFQMLQAIGQYSGAAIKYLYLHVRPFLEVASNFKIPRIIDDDFRLRLFSYSLRDRAKFCLYSLEPNSMATWNPLAEQLLAKYFPHIKSEKMSNEITSFR